MRKRVSWGITEGQNQDPRIRVQGSIYAVPEVSAHILSHMRTVAEEALGEKVDKAVITVPAYFNDQQRQATRNAAEIAGLDCLRIINEPTAAALAYGYKKKRKQNIAIYDLGGGTFDISILRVDDDFFEVLSTAGDTFLGGDDFDLAITEYLIDQIKQDTGVDLTNKYVGRAKLREAAERAKVVLSSQAAFEINIPNLSRSRKGRTINLQTQLDRGTLKKLCMPLIQKTFLVVDDAIRQAGLSAMQIDSVVLVGGMTRSPLIREAVGQYFRKPAHVDINPDEVVALGAAIQAFTLSTAESATVLVDVIPQSLGIRTVGGFVRHLIERNSSIPTEIHEVFYPASDNQTEVRIQVYQGEKNQVEENTFLGDFVLGGIRPAKRGQIPIKVTFTVDSDGIVKVRAKNEETDEECDMLIEASSNLSKSEIAALRFLDD